jgi:hypothetical protein
METIEIQRGNPYSKTLEFKDAAGNSLNLIGRTIYISVKKLRDNSDTDVNALISKTITSHSTPASGLSILALTAQDTTIPLRTYKADIRVMGAGFQANTTAFQIRIIRPITERTS